MVYTCRIKDESVMIDFGEGAVLAPNCRAIVREIKRVLCRQDTFLDIASQVDTGVAGKTPAVEKNDRTGRPELGPRGRTPPT
jgi:hypothetical protein